MLNLSTNLTEEFKRFYHGRGEEKYKFLSIDSIDKVLFVQFFEEVNEKPILEFLKEYIKNTRHENIIVKRRYKNETFAYVGEIPEKYYAIENGLKFILNFYNKNIGYFGDMKNTREYIEKISKDKKVLNLFSYTCGFSMYARIGGAKEVINIDMNKSVLITGQKNHQINNLPLKNIRFLRRDVLKDNFKKFAPYDIVIIDPPTFQKGSFIASIDYIKIIKRLNDFSNENTILIACVNSPSISKEDLINLVKNNSNFKYKKEVKPPKEYTNSSLKSLVFY